MTPSLRDIGRRLVELLLEAGGAMALIANPFAAAATAAKHSRAVPTSVTIPKMDGASKD